MKSLLTRSPRIPATSGRPLRLRRLLLGLGLAFGLLPLASLPSQAGSVVVIGHASLSRLEAATVEKIFTGKAIEVGGVPVTAINASSGSSLRQRFLQSFLNQDEEKYTAYWTVRRYIGKGAPPREVASAAEVISFVQSTPGAIGYIDEADLRPGMNVLVKR
jgi:ABC-type phosphate transport system substrate-binding protein